MKRIVLLIVSFMVLISGSCFASVSRNTNEFNGQGMVTSHRQLDAETYIDYMKVFSEYGTGSVIIVYHMGNNKIFDDYMYLKVDNESFTLHRLDLSSNDESNTIIGSFSIAGGIEMAILQGTTAKIQVVYNNASNSTYNIDSDVLAEWKQVLRTQKDGRIV